MLIVIKRKWASKQLTSSWDWVPTTCKFWSMLLNYYKHKSDSASMNAHGSIVCVLTAVSSTSNEKGPGFKGQVNATKQETALPTYVHCHKHAKIPILPT